MSIDQQYMYKTFELALKGKGLTSPNPMVGAVLVKNGKIVGQGYHRRCGGDHAEIRAIKEAGLKARGATLYVNLEPCYHFGRTPPCVNRVIESGVKRVVVAVKDPNPLTRGKSIRKLKRAGIKVTVGVLEELSLRLNEAFVYSMTKHKPFVVAKCAQSLDGKIATANGESKWITSVPSRNYARGLRNNFDAILVGINTILKDNPGLNAVKKTKKLKKIVLDPGLKISLKAKIFYRTSKQDCIIATTKKASLRKLNILKQEGVTVLVCPSRAGRIDLVWLMKRLYMTSITSVLIEGGAKTIGAALKSGVVDKLHIYIAPVIFGDQNALSAIDGVQIKGLKQAVELKGMTVHSIDKDLFITGYV